MPETHVVAATHTVCKRLLCEFLGAILRDISIFIVKNLFSINMKATSGRIRLPAAVSHAFHSA